MQVRQATSREAKRLWQIRNLAIRHGCQGIYPVEVLLAWTPDIMPASFPEMINENPFYVIDGPTGEAVATGSLDLRAASVEAIFTLPEFCRQGLAGTLLTTIKAEARKRGFTHLTLSSTPNAVTFYQRHGFRLLRESYYPSTLAGTNLRCMELDIAL